MNHQAVTSLLSWYQDNHRLLPWRSNSPDPYAVWISEIMLQQTQVITVIPYFNRFITALPTVETLATASEHTVLKLWEGLGYYSRARNMHASAKRVHASGWPKTYKDLQALPGLGFYTAAAVASIAFGEPVPVVDGNVIRVMTRLMADKTDSTTARMKQQLFANLQPVIQHYPPAVFNQAIMELGAMICHPKQPKCDQCPLQPHCLANQHNLTTTIPNRPRKAPVPHYTVGVGVIIRNQQMLIGKRKSTQMLGGLWEFPGGKQHPSESITETVCREIKEETGLTVTCHTCITVVKHAYTHFKITVHAYQCHCDDNADPIPYTTDELRWVRHNELSDYPFPTASKKIIASLTPDMLL